jgi:hypothetical protein
MGRIATLVLVLGLSVSACSTSKQPEISQVRGSPDSRTIEVSVSSCKWEGLVIGLVGETTQELRIRAMADGGGNDEECAQFQLVHLAEPLGNRRVINDVTGNEIEVRGPDT